MLTYLQKNSQDLRKDLKKEDLKKSHSELKNTVLEMKCTMEGFNSRLSQAEDIVNDMKIREQENNVAEKQREKRNSRNERIKRAE